MNRFVFLFTIVLGGALVGASCQKPTPPTPTPTPSPAPTLLSADQVTAELVDAGCLAPGPSGPIAQELATGHDPWLGCLFEGGTIAACNAPCQRAGFVQRPGDR